VPRVSYPPELPIAARADEIVAALRSPRQRVVIISGETGCGKSTQIPKMCLEAGRGINGRIGVTQPRRLAAMTIAYRIAEELGETLGRSVGYKIRFQDRTSRDGYIKVMTDGILLAETQGDHGLHEYDTIIIDEAHERSLNIDFLLGIMRRLLDERPDLKLVITSATLDTEKFSKAFRNAPVIEVSGRLYPVEVEYRPTRRRPRTRITLTKPSRRSNTCGARSPRATSWFSCRPSRTSSKPAACSRGASGPWSKCCRSSRACRRASSASSTPSPCPRSSWPRTSPKRR
jgi:HrpA-like RNA helicase